MFSVGGNRRQPPGNNPEITPTENTPEETPLDSEDYFSCTG